jgi:hypothetical protein
MNADLTAYTKKALATDPALLLAGHLVQPDAHTAASSTATAQDVAA